MQEIVLRPVAIVKNRRTEPIDDQWGTIESEITLCEDLPTAVFDRISDFSQLEVIYYFHQVDEKDIVFSGRPRGNPQYPVTGIFAQRKKDRPNRIGLCRVQLIAHEGRTIRVSHLDAIDGTPVLDIKPIFREFELKGVSRQPEWVSDLMKDYWG
jgi:tRNA (adenine37-N6)-methyltransferase